LFSGTELLVKVLAQRYPIPQLVWGRFVVQALLLLALFAPTMRMRLFRPPELRLQMYRGIALIASTYLYYEALKRLPLADATAIAYTGPVFVMLMSVAVLRERITWQRVAFAIAGFTGMLIIVRPGASIFDGAAMFALSAAVLFAAFQILTRSLHGADARV